MDPRTDRSVASTEIATGAGAADGEAARGRRDRIYAHRWWTLVVLSVSLLIVIIDDTIINVAVPTLQRELGASASELH